MRHAPLIVKKLMSWVRPGSEETFARALRPASRLSSDDFPTFDRPMNGNSGNPGGGHTEMSAALVSKTAERMIIREVSGIQRRAGSYQMTRSLLRKGDLHHQFG